MRTIKLLVAYDGTDFCGWQRQSPLSNDTRTVQGIIESALEKMHKHPVTLAGAGRTDSGVHAAGQVAHFHTDIDSIPSERFVPALNGLLPQDIRILESAEAPADFHARFDARMRTYRYYFICGRQALPHESRYALQLWREPRVDHLNAYCRLLPGERDCSIFAGAGEKLVPQESASPKEAGHSRSRYISHAAFFIEGSRMVFEISANAFLWKMVRSIGGTLLHYEERDTPPETLAEIIASGRRELAGPTLPPQGLFLWKVDYYQK
jgi:tRNA pseudouridine38-40 synthase